MPSNTGYWNAAEAEVNHDFSENLAEWIKNYLPKEQSVIDFGCGNGKYVKALGDRWAMGIEGDIFSVTEKIPCIDRDLTQPFKNVFDNGICLEVGEHIPAEYTQQFIDNITGNVRNKLILSWATPGQEGYYHVNCQPNVWVVNEMKQRGFTMLLDDSFSARDSVEDRFDYFRNTIMIFQRTMTLDQLGKKHDTDKASHHHDYCKVYEQYLAPYRFLPISLIEIGVGGYHFIDRGGQSLRMWYEYFQRAKLIGVDIFNKEGIVNDRTEFWQGSQIDKDLLSAIIEREEDAPVRVIIDDASHVNSLTIETFKNVFPLLKSGDMYFVEDVHTSYWKDYYDGNEVPGAEGTTMGYFSSLTHQLNHATLLPQYRNEFAGMIEFIHFYKELIVIKKL